MRHCTVIFSARRQWDVAHSTVRAIATMRKTGNSSTADDSLEGERSAKWAGERSVLVTDGSQRSSLAATRALARSGFRVLVCSEQNHSIAAQSRFCRHSWTVSNPLSRPDRYVEELVRIAEREAPDVVIPMTEPSLLALLPEWKRLWPAVIPFGDSETVTSLLDKEEVLRRAPAHGIAVPDQVIVTDPASQHQSVKRLTLPVVLKPSRSVGTFDGERRKVTVSHVGTWSEFDARIKRLPRASFPLLVQERIEGAGTGIFLLLDSEGVVARFAHRRLREKPPSGGVSVLRESIRPGEALFRKAQSLLEDFGWEGVAMVEFRICAQSGVPYLMEINPRLWGSLQLAIDAGVDFPSMLVKSTLGEHVSRTLDYDVGVQTRWFWGELDHLIARAKSAIGREDSPPDRKAVLLAKLIGEFVSGWRTGAKLEVLDWSDPWPFLRESLDWWKAVLWSGELEDV